MNLRIRRKKIKQAITPKKSRIPNPPGEGLRKRRAAQCLRRGTTEYVSHWGTSDRGAS